MRQYSEEFETTDHINCNEFPLSLSLLFISSVKPVLLNQSTEKLRLISQNLVPDLDN